MIIDANSPSMKNTVLLLTTGNSGWEFIGFSDWDCKQYFLKDWKFLIFPCQFFSSLFSHRMFENCHISTV